jgi:hypothetical protein
VRSSGASARVWTRPGRLAAAALVALSRGSLALVALAAVTVAPALLEPPTLVPILAGLSLGPALVGWALGRASAAELELEGDDLVVRRRGLEIEVPLASIARVEPWRLPLPGPGLGLRLRSGRLLRWGLELPDPTPLLRALAARGVESADMAARHPTAVFARARAVAADGRWGRPLVKFALFSLAPTAVLFRAHQHIAYGGTLGQYYLEGLRPYLATLAFYWATVALYLLLYASAWRALAEGVSWASAHLAPARAIQARRAAERTCLAAYYAGVPALLAVRFLA